jgi:pimeloyl-ACP methyl ester carboxylesterase
MSEPQSSPQSSKPPVLFIHGLWIHPQSWASWIEEFSRAGYTAASAPGWPGVADTVQASRDAPDAIADHGIEDVTEHYRQIINGLGALPIIVGHSFGGMIAQKLLGEGRAAAVVAIDAAQIKGVLPLPLSALHSTLPVFKNPANKHRAVSLTAEQFRYSFGNAVEPEESDQLWSQWAIPAPGRPLFEAAAANFSLHSPAKVETDNPDRGPLLLVSGGKDHTVPESITKSTAKQYRHSPAETEVMDFPDRGHSLTIDHGWPEIAQAALTWLGKHSL